MHDLISKGWKAGPEKDKIQEWANQAAQNAMDILPHLVHPSEAIPVIRLEDVARRIEANFQDRTSWNESVHESTLSGEVKLWLVVP